MSSVLKGCQPQAVSGTVLESRVKGASGQVEENAAAGCHMEYLGKIREDPAPTLSNLKRE